MKKMLISVSTILCLVSCTKEELYTPISLNPHLKVTGKTVYVVNVASLPQVEDINDSYSFYRTSDIYQNTVISEDGWSMDLPGFTDEWNFYVSNNGITTELQIEEIY